MMMSEVFINKKELSSLRYVTPSKCALLFIMLTFTIAPLPLAATYRLVVPKDFYYPLRRAGRVATLVNFFKKRVPLKVLIDRI